MMPIAFPTLLVEDNPADAFLVRKLLSSVPGPAAQFGRFEVQSVTCLDAALEALRAHEYEAVLLDLSLPDSRGLDTLRSVRAVAPGMPIVVLTGSSDAELALQALTLGAQDFLSKDNLSPELIVRTLRYAIERRRVQHQLVSALREKEVLLGELHHRAKNNLQLISSLLRMQSRRSDNARFRELAIAAQQRIEAIALAQDQLHRAPDLSRIDFSAYLHTLTRALHASYGGAESGVTLELSLGSCELPLSAAVPAGLVVNELVTNSFKHAFPADRPGSIRIRAAVSDTRIVLEVADNGVGIPLVPKHGGERSLGLEIVATLVEQLNARLERNSDAGTLYRLSFPSRGTA